MLLQQEQHEKLNWEHNAIKMYFTVQIFLEQNFNFLFVHSCLVPILQFLHFSLASPSISSSAIPSVQRNYPASRSDWVRVREWVPDEIVNPYFLHFSPIPSQMEEFEFSWIQSKNNNSCKFQMNWKHFPKTYRYVVYLFLLKRMKNWKTRFNWIGCCIGEYLIIHRIRLVVWAGGWW